MTSLQVRPGRVPALLHCSESYPPSIRVQQQAHPPPHCYYWQHLPLGAEAVPPLPAVPQHLYLEHNLLRVLPPGPYWAGLRVLATDWEPLLRSHALLGQVRRRGACQGTLPAPVRGVLPVPATMLASTGGS